MNKTNISVNEKFYKLISEEIKNGDEISIKDIYSLFPKMNKKTISWRLYSLVQKGKLLNTGRGFYSIKQKSENNLAAGYDYLQEKSKIIYNILIDYGYKFYITGLDSLVGEILHIPENYPVIIVIEEPGMKEVQEILNEQKLIALTEKDREIMDKTILKNRIDAILLTGKDFSLSKDNISIKEKGFVDLYYAVTRMDYGLSIPELSRIYQNLQRNKSILMTNMKNSARDRGVSTEINWLIELNKASEKTLKFMNYQIKEAK